MTKAYFTLLALFLASITSAGDDKWLSPVYNNFYEFPLPLPVVKQPKATYTSIATGKPIDYYEIEIKPVEQQVYPNLRKARLVGYDGQVPGPTFKMTQGRESVVRFINHGDRANSVHLHGSYSRAPFDGWAEDLTEPGQYKDYYYPNAQNARTLWYHDHAIDHTAENAYYGQAGFYILHDPEELALGLPQGDYDIPLALAAKQYNADGTLFDPEANDERVSLWGDVIHVNGQPWPFFKVEPRRYRIRFLNTGISRSFNLWFETDGKTKIPMTVIGSDAGLVTNPVKANDVYISDAERWEVIFDFTSYAGKNVTLRNSRDVGHDEDYAGTDRVMRFVVGNTVTSQDGNKDPPSPLRTVPFPPNKNGVDRSFKFERSNGRWEINKVVWSDVAQRIMAKPQRGAIEVWELENGGGGWTHPIHIHLIDFQILSRSGGRGKVEDYEKVSLKDVVWLGEGETVKVIARYAPWDGLYMFHCHNLIHEDHEMMAAFNVTVLQDLNYTETTRFLDPMEPRYRAKSFPPGDFVGVNPGQFGSGDFSEAAIKAKIDFFASLDAYAHVGEAEKALEEYWKTHTTLVTSTRSSGGGSGSGNGGTTSSSPDSSSSARTTSTKTSSSSSSAKTASTKR